MYLSTSVRVKGSVSLTRMGASWELVERVTGGLVPVCDGKYVNRETASLCVFCALSFVGRVGKCRGWGVGE